MAEVVGGPAREPSRGRRLAVAGLYVLLGAVAAVEVGRDLASPGDYDRFIAFGRAALSRQIPYDPAVEHSYILAHWATWPPAFAPIAAVMARLDGLWHEPAVLLFQLANLAALLVVLAVLVRWLYGRRLTLGVPLAGPEPEWAPLRRRGRGPRGGGSGGRRGDRPGMPLAALPVLGALLVPFRLVLSNFEHAQSNLIILALAVGGMWLLHRKRRWEGGLALGLATAFKATPLLLLPYLIWRGRWKDLGAALAGCAVTWLVLPAMLLGPRMTAVWYSAWSDRSAAAVRETSALNQSLLALLQRLFPGLPGWPVFLAAAVALGLIALAAFGRPGRGVSTRREALEVAVVLAGMSVLSPLSWKAHFVTLVPLAGALLALTPAGIRWRVSAAPGLRTRSPADPAVPRLPEEPGHRAVHGGWVLYMVLGAAFLAINVPSHGLIGRTAAMELEWAGIVTLSALALLGTALVVLVPDRGTGR